MKAKKYDKDKTRYDLLPVKPLEYLAKVYTQGAKKYEDNNWRKGMKWGRVYAAIQRHLQQFWAGDDINSEDFGLPHLAHAAWGIFTLLEYMETNKELDDRFKTKGGE